MKKLFIIPLIALLVSCSKTSDAPLAEEDAALVALLNELDECQTSGSRERCYAIYAKISSEYEKKNMTKLQKYYQQKMVIEAGAISEDNLIRGRKLMAEALQRLATTYMVEGNLDSAAIEAHKSYQLAPIDTLNFRSETLLLLAQIHLMTENGDSVVYYVREAKRIDPDVSDTDLYRITHAYGLDLMKKENDLMALLPSYISESGIHAQAELTRLLMYHHEEARQWQEAYDDATQLMMITDSIAKTETSENMARIHALQHERQLESLRAKRQTEKARMYIIIIVILILLLAASVAGLSYRRKARIAHAKELEAMRLSEVAQANEDIVREENVKLQRLYYEHLYAIILPILNTCRGKSGHINLEESSWELLRSMAILPRLSGIQRQTEEIVLCKY